MGVNAYVFSDHMHTGYSEREFQESEIANPNRKLDKATFLRMLELPYVDNLYFRIDWNRFSRSPAASASPRNGSGCWRRWNPGASVGASG